MESRKINFAIYVITVLFTAWTVYSYKDIAVDIKKSMIIALVIIISFGILLLKMKEKKFSRKIPVFSCMWVLLYILLPLGAFPEFKNLESIKNISKLGWNSLLILSLATLLIMHIFLNKYKYSVAFILLNYICGELFWRQFIYEMTNIQIGELSICLAILFLSLDVYFYINNQRISYFRFFNILHLVAFIIFTTYMSEKVFIILYAMDLINKVSNWKRIIIIVLGCGTACILEDYKNWKDVSKLPVPDSLKIGLACFLTALYMLAAKIWPSCFNLWFLFGVGILSIIGCESFLKALEKLDIKEISLRGVGLFYCYWGGAIVWALTIGKTINIYPQYLLLIVGFFVLRAIVDFAGTKINERNRFLLGFWGTAAPVLLFFAKYDFEIVTLRGLLPQIYMLAGSIILWILLLNNTWNFNQVMLKGKYPKEEYVVVPRIQAACISVIYVVTVLLLLRR